MRVPLLIAALLGTSVSVSVAQTSPAAPEDVSSPEAIVAAGYEAIQRPPGENYDWERFRSLFLLSALMIPNTEQTGGEHRVFTVQEFTDYIDSVTTVGGEGDRGFAEEQIASSIETYGDVAHVLSTYQKRFWDDDEILGRGINSFQLVHANDRWWIASVAWDEDSGAGPIPEKYMP